MYGFEALPYYANVLNIMVRYMNRRNITIVNKIMKEHKSIDLLINNASLTGAKYTGDRFTIINLDVEDWNKMISVALTGSFICTKFVSPHMIKQNWGRIINTSSIHGFVGSDYGSSHYASAKAGLIGFTKAVALDLAEKNILVNAVSPGFVDTELTRKILDEKGIDSKDVMGSGRDGRVTKEDAVEAKASMGSPGKGSRGEERKKMSMFRRKLAERLVSAKNDTAMLTTFNEVDMSPIFALRKKYKEEFKEKHGVSLGFMSFFTLAVIRALDEYPAVNSMIDGDYQVSYDFKDISIAVSGPKGLTVPVIRNAENLSFRGVEDEVKRLALRARDGKITVDEMTGGTFTITNGGVFGSMLSTPIINPPQSAILGMHNIVERPIAIDGKVFIRPVMYLALSYDHRIIDGRESVGFLVSIKEALENPAEILMGNKILETLELK